MNNYKDIARQIAHTGEIPPSAEGWLVSSFTAWYRDGCEPDRLIACLHIPTGSRAATGERNRWLIEAANHLPEHNVAAELHRIVKAFMRKEWREWRGDELPPEGADDVLQSLFFAAQSGAPMTIGRRQMGSILRG